MKKKKRAVKAANYAKKRMTQKKPKKLTREDLLMVGERTQSGERVSWWQC